MRTLALIRPVQFDHSPADAVSLHYRLNGLNSPVFLDALLTHVDTLANRGGLSSPLHSDLWPLQFLGINIVPFHVKHCVFHGYRLITFIIQCLNKIRSAITFGGTYFDARRFSWFRDYGTVHGRQPGQGRTRG